MTNAAVSRTRVAAASEDFSGRTIVRLAAFPTIIFPVSVARLRPLIAKIEHAAIRPPNKIDNSIVNNIEGSYHPQKSAVSSLAKHANADGDNSRNEGGMNETSGQEFRRQRRRTHAVETARPSRISY
jgi:hypothetical protein